MKKNKRHDPNKRHDGRSLEKKISVIVLISIIRVGKQKNLINVTAFFNKRHRDFHEIRGITLPVKSINNVHRSFVGTEHAPLQSMPPSSSCFKVFIHNKNLHSLPFD